MVTLNTSTSRVHIGPKNLPTSLTAELDFDCKLKEFQITNMDPTNARTVTIQDRQSSPKVFIKILLFADGGIWTYEDTTGRLMPNGISWMADGANVNGHMVVDI